MSVPKSKVLSVSKGLMALADFKQACPNTTSSQTVYVNVNSKPEKQPPKHPVIDGEVAEDITIVPSTETITRDEDNKDVKVVYADENPYANLETKTRALTTTSDVKSDIEQLEALVKQKEDIAEALSIMLNLVENNPLIINKCIIAPESILNSLIKLLASADEVSISLVNDGDIGCTCGKVEYLVVDKIYVTKNNDTQVLKYAYADVIKLLDDHKISYKLVANDL